MNAVFVDTSGLIAVVNTVDQWHDCATAVWQQLLESQAALVTTSYVLVEIGDGLSRVHHRPLAVQLYDHLRSSHRVEIVPAASELEEEGWDLFRGRDDKEWSVTDCCSFVVMQRHGIPAAFTTDHHFEQAGFQRLLRP